MKIYRFFLMVFLSAAGFLSVSDAPKTDACAGSATSVCTVSQTACLKTIVLSKAIPLVIVIQPATSTNFNVPANIFIKCPTATNCGTPCPSGGNLPTSSILNISLFPFASPPVGMPTASGSISTAAGTMTLPVCSAGGSFNSYSVPITIPAGTPFGVYRVIGETIVTFSDGTTLRQRGDTVVCLVEPAPGQPTVPRLNLELLTPPFQRSSPGDQHGSMYRVTNNDPTRSVTLTAFATSTQNALKPQGGNEQQGVFTISNPFGDDFPIAFNPGATCIPLPEHPFTQPEINMPLPVLMPGQTTTITLGIRSYGQCASGSCSESTLRVSGTYSNGDPAFACVGMALFADTSMPTQNCGIGVNDCNNNGIPDAVDIANNPSLDMNFNALPDTCEQGQLLRISPVQISKPVAVPLEIIQLSLVSQGPVQVTNVWANGVPMISAGGINWTGQIPAASTVGQHTVYAIAKDANGRLATNIGTYRVVSNRAGDFDGDNKADLAVVRRTGGSMIWYILNSTGGVTTQQHGIDTDIPTPGDYNGDRHANIAVWRGSNGTFYPDLDPATNYGYFPWGQMGDRPVIGDYDGDGRTDFTVYRPSNNTFYEYDSLSRRIRSITFGTGNDKPLAGDYDGDGRTDIAVWRDTDGVFYSLNSVNNTFSAAQWGQSGDQPIVGDFDGDGKTDLCVFRAGVWWVRKSSDSSVIALTWGIPTDIIAPADYDGDGKTDFAVYRNGIWHILRSSDGGYMGIQWGTATDTPVQRTYQP